MRELSRKNNQLSKEECLQVLKSETRGVLSVIGDEGYPYGMPMNHLYDDDGCIYFHCGKNGGHRLDALKKCSKVCFTIFTKGEAMDSEWALKVKSVIVFGRISIIYDQKTVNDISIKLSHKFTSDDEYIKKEIELYAKNTVILKLVPDHICGKLVTES